MKTTVREIFDVEARWMKDEGFLGFESRGKLLRIRVCGSGFLKQMVRGMVGTWLDISKSKKPMEDLTQILATQDLSLIGMTAPAHGLWLHSVEYPEVTF